jgi:hypothetical protein
VRLGRADAAHSEKCLVSSGLEPLCEVWHLDDGGGFFISPMWRYFYLMALFFISLTTKINGATSFLLTKM